MTFYCSSCHFLGDFYFNLHLHTRLVDTLSCLQLVVTSFITTNFVFMSFFFFGFLGWVRETLCCVAQAGMMRRRPKSTFVCNSSVVSRSHVCKGPSMGPPSGWLKTNLTRKVSLWLRSRCRECERCHTFALWASISPEPCQQASSPRIVSTTRTCTV